jgi:FkbH-like protein
VSAPVLGDVLAALAQPGWRGFARLRRYRAESADPQRPLVRALRSVPWSGRGDLEARAVRVAFVGTASTANLDDALWLEALDRGLVPETQHSGSRQPSRELRDPAGELTAFRPDAVVVAAEPAAGDDPAAFVADLIADLRAFRAHSQALLLVHGLVEPDAPPCGIAGAPGPHAAAQAALVAGCREIADAWVVDVAGALLRGGARWATLHRGRFVGGLALPAEAALPLARDYAALLAARRGLARKVLALDLDDTLWGGVVGEAGASGLALGRDFPGNVFVALQQVVRRLRDRGVLLALLSRNDEDAGWAPFRERPEMVLRREDVAAFRIDWQDKAQNLRALAAELRLGTDSFVFLDNDPVQRAWMEEQLPEVYVIPAGDPLDMLHALAATRVFDGLGATAEDALRAESYAAGARRRQEETAAPDREAFLASLGLEVTVLRATSAHVARVAQLTQRTNQFNLTTRRYTEGEIRALLDAQDVDVVCCSCRDRFAEEGVVGVAVLRTAGALAEIEALLVSCRVLGRGVEHAFGAAVARIAAARGATHVRGAFVRTAKNGLAEGFYSELGFAAEDDEGGRWRHAADPPPPAPAWIDLRLTVTEENAT